MKKQFWYLIILLTGVITCDDESYADKKYPRVETLDITEAKNGNLVFSGKITFRSDHKITKHGFVWSVVQDPNLEKSFKEVTEGAPKDDIFLYEVTSGVVDNTVQYVRAFLQTDNYVIYGPIVSFKPSKIQPLLEEISPAEADVNETVIIKGLNFNQLPENFGILFGDVEGEILSVSDTEIAVKVPQGLIDDRNLSVTKTTLITIRAAGATFKLDQLFTLSYPGKWIQLNDFPGTARIGAVCFKVGDTGYFGFGSSRCPATTYYNDLWKYNKQTDSWTQIATPMAARATLTPFVYGTKVYLVGGRTNSGATKEVWEFDSITEAWTKKSDFPGVIQNFGFGFVIGNHGYYGCATSDHTCGNSYNNQFWRYDIATDSWTKLDDIFTGEAIGQIAVNTSNRFFILKDVRKLYEFNGSNEKWEFVSQIPFATYNPLSSFNFNDNIIAFGSTLRQEGAQMVYQFDLSTMKWENRTYLSDLYSEAIGGFAIDNTGIVLVNKNPFQTIEVWKLDP